MDASPPYEEQLRTVISFLNTEGLYAAQEALLQELQNRLPPDEGPGSSCSGSHHSEAPPSHPPAPAVVQPHDAPLDQPHDAHDQPHAPPAPPSESATTSSVGPHHSRQQYAWCPYQPSSHPPQLHRLWLGAGHPTGHTREPHLPLYAPCTQIAHTA